MTVETTPAPTKFWMVKGDGPTSCIHRYQVDAEVEACRLAVANPGKLFFVLEAVACHRKVTVERIALPPVDDGDALPF